MKEVFFRRYLLLILTGLMCCILLSWGCRGRTEKVRDKDKEPGQPVVKIVVAGYEAAMPRGEKPGSVRDPSRGTVFVAESVPPEAVSVMTALLFDWLAEDERYELVSPGQAKGVYSRIVESDRDVGIDTNKILQKVGKTFGADAVLSGYIYRWQERDGTDYGVNRPASVAFDLELLNPQDGSIIWRRKFDKTQTSLTENILDISTFVKGRGRWMTAEELAKLGLRVMLADMPGGLKSPEKASKSGQESRER